MDALPSPSSAPLEAKWRFFLIMLIGATLTPLIFFPISTHFNASSASIVAIAAFINFLGSGVHVGATGFFYTDSEVRRHFLQNRWRYYFIPLLLVAGTGIVYSLSTPTVTAYLVIGYFAWQTYHYQKQNYGIFSFIAAGTDRIRPTLLERAILQLSVFLGILGLLKTYNLAKNTALLRFSDSIYETAAYAFWIIPVLLLAAAAFSPALRRNPLRMIFLALGGFFYLPIFLFTNPVAAVSGYAAGHGLQYLVFMYFVGASKPDRDLRIIILAAVALVAGTVLALMSDTTLWGQPAKIVFGCYLGLVMSHFVIDAGIWKLREAFPRRYMSNAFNFVFLRGSKAAPGEAPAMPVTGSPTGGRMQALAT